MSSAPIPSASPSSGVPFGALPTEGLASARYRWLVGLALALVQSAVYFGIGHTELHRSTEMLRTSVDDAIPFWPWTAWCYLPFYVGVFVIAIAGFQRRALFDRTARSVLLVMFI